MIHRSIPAVEADKTWQQQYSEAKISLSELLEQLDINSLDIASEKAAESFELRVPEAYLNRIVKGDPSDPLLKQILPTSLECIDEPGFVSDPLDEQAFSVSEGIIQKYQSRVLLIVTQACAVHCRYCFRREFPYSKNRFHGDMMESLREHIACHPSINEVILSGGDPLSASDEYLSKILEELESINQIQRIRFHTRLPVVIPDRVTDTLCEAISSSGKHIIIVTHINHAQEIDHSVQDAILKLREAGAHLLNQSVLLKDVNDTPEALIALSERLFETHILPYYLFELDRVRGTKHFEVPSETIKSLHQSLLDNLPGYLVPTIAREIPHKTSKTPINLS